MIRAVYRSTVAQAEHQGSSVKCYGLFAPSFRFTLSFAVGGLYCARQRRLRAQNLQPAVATPTYFFRCQQLCLSSWTLHLTQTHRAGGRLQVRVGESLPPSWQRIGVRRRCSFLPNSESRFLFTAVRRCDVVLPSWRTCAASVNREVRRSHERTALAAVCVRVSR